MTKHILVTSFKGGVGKTTVTVNLAAALSFIDSLGETLIIDGDVRGDVRRCIGDLVEPRDGLFQWIDSDQMVPAATPYDNLTFLPGGPKTGRLGLMAVTEGLTPDRLLDTIGGITGYDYVVWDVPANIASLYPAVMMLADVVVIPTRLDGLGLADVFSVLRSTHKEHAIVVGNVASITQTTHKENWDALCAELGGVSRVLIDKSAEMRRLTEERIPVVYASVSSNVARRVKDSYLLLADLVLTKLGVVA